MIRRIRRTILFIVGITIPIGVQSVSLGPLRATPFKFATVALLILAAIQISQRAGQRPQDPKFFWVSAFGLSWVVGLLMSILAGLPPAAVIQAGTTLMALVAYYYLIGFTVRSHDDLTLLLWALAVGGGITALPAALGIKTGGTELQYGVRQVGLSGQTNRFGSDMTMCLAVALGLYFTARSRFARALAGGSAVVALMGAILSLSRAAFLALGAMWVFWIYRSGRTGAIRWAIPAVFLGLGALLMAPESVKIRFETMVNPELRARDESIQGRFVMGVWAIKAFASNPVVGVGANRFAIWVNKQPDGAGVAYHTIHNAFLSIAAEQGLLGLIPFIMMLSLTWIDFNKVWRLGRARSLLRDPVLNQYVTFALYLQMALLGRIVSALFHQGHRSKVLWTLFAISSLLLALARTRAAELEQGSAQEQEPLPDWRTLPPPRHGLPAGRAPVR